ncbi:UNVERIFIED_CONTAM: hypothetical protein H355_001742 [Colinus virginianus]|nr:hypothetical protein H355_001742 [Colinus virginianus]
MWGRRGFGSELSIFVTKKVQLLLWQLSQGFFFPFFQFTLRDNKKLVPVTIIKQVIQNRTQSKTSDSSSLPGAILGDKKIFVSNFSFSVTEN